MRNILAARRWCRILACFHLCMLQMVLSTSVFLTELSFALNIGSVQPQPPPLSTHCFGIGFRSHMYFQSHFSCTHVCTCILVFQGEWLVFNCLSVHISMSVKYQIITSLRCLGSEIRSSTCSTTLSVLHVPSSGSVSRIHTQKDYTYWWNKKLNKMDSIYK